MIFVRDLTDKEMQELYLLMEDEEVGLRAKMILLSSEGYTVPEIRERTNTHDGTIRKWIHRFNKKGIEGLLPVPRTVKNPRITKEQREMIVEVATTEPRELGMKFSNWSLRRLVWYVETRAKIVEKISHERIRQILAESGIKWRNTRTTMSSRDPEYDLKKTSSESL
jgi:transposase